MAATPLHMVGAQSTVGEAQRVAQLALQANMAHYRDPTVDELSRGVQSTNGLKPSLETGPQLGGTANSFITAAGMTPDGSRNRAPPGQVRITHQQAIGYATLPIIDHPVVIYSVNTRDNEYETRSYRDPNYLRCASLTSADYHRSDAWRDWDRSHVCVVTPEEYRTYMRDHGHMVLGRFGQEIAPVHRNPWDVDVPVYHHRNYAFTGMLMATYGGPLGRKAAEPLAKRPKDAAEPGNPHQVRLTDYTLTTQLVNVAECFGSWSATATAANPVRVSAGSAAYHYVPALEPGFLLKFFVGYHRKSLVVRHSPFDLFDSKAQTKAIIDLVVGPTSNPLDAVAETAAVGAAGRATPRANLALRWVHDAYRFHDPAVLVAGVAHNAMPREFVDYFPAPATLVGNNRDYQFTAAESLLGVRA